MASHLNAGFPTVARQYLAAADQREHHHQQAEGQQRGEIALLPGRTQMAANGQAVVELVGREAVLARMSAQLKFFPA